MYLRGATLSKNHWFDKLSKLRALRSKIRDQIQLNILLLALLLCVLYYYPQGAVIVPLLFNIYTANQPTTQNTIVIDFADDKALLACHSDPNIAASFIQTRLDLLASWHTEWGLKLNQMKSLYSTFTLRLRDCSQLFLNNQPLPYSQNVKYLELILDRRLTWAPHIRSKRLTLNILIWITSSLFTKCYSNQYGFMVYSSGDQQNLQTSIKY